MHSTLFLCLAAFVFASTATAAEIRRIDADYRGGGLGGNSRDSIVISLERNGTYTIQGDSTHAFPPDAPPSERTRYQSSTISNTDIETFERTIRAKPWPREQFVAHLITPQWLQQNAASAFVRKTCSAQAEQLFRARYFDPKNASKALIDYYDSNWTDDYPLAKIVVTFRDGKTFTLKSGQQQDGMLPWNGDQQSNWNIEISRTLAKLLPAKSYLRARLSEDSLVEEIAQGVKAPIKDDWDDLEMRCVHRDVLPLIESKFQILRLYSSTANVTGYIRRMDMPKNFAVNVVLAKSEPQAKRAEVQEFLRKIDRYIDISLPFVRAHPETRFKVWYADRQSFGGFELSMGPDDPKLKDIVAPIATRCALLMEHDYWNGRRWVVLPDKRTYLWRDRHAYDTKRPGAGW